MLSNNGLLQTEMQCMRLHTLREKHKTLLSKIEQYYFLTKCFVLLPFTSLTIDHKEMTMDAATAKAANGMNIAAAWVLS